MPNEIDNLPVPDTATTRTRIVAALAIAHEAFRST